MNLQKIRKFLEKCNILIEVIDSRAIEQTRLIFFEKKYKDKLIIVATKKDLLESQRIEKLKEDYPNIHFLNTKDRAEVNQLKQKIFEIAFKKMQKNNRNNRISIFVFGLPNVGKSSLINALANRKVAAVGFRVGITKGIQWIKLADNILLLDSPGIIKPKTNEYDLALSASIDAEKLKQPYLAASRLLERFFKEKKQSKVFEYFKIPVQKNPSQTILEIAKKRGFYIKGGELNLDQAARVIIREWQKGRLKI
jgi:ribosome biogenesis GTPase A